MTDDPTDLAPDDASSPDRPDQAEQTERPDRPDQAEQTEQAERTERAEQPEGADRMDLADLAPAPEWPAATLARRADLPRPPDVGILRTERLTVRPYAPADAAELHAISSGAPVERLGRAVEGFDPEVTIWRFMPWGPFATAADLGAGHDALAAAPTNRVLVVVADDGLVGSVSLLNSRPADMAIEIGAVWYTPAVQGLGVNREVTLGLADALFAQGYQRYEWKCDSRNLRSRRAAAGMGFTYEGIQRAHMVSKGRRRDTAWYSLLADDAR